jgi:hypothetical protein
VRSLDASGDDVIDVILDHAMVLPREGVGARMADEPEANP